MKRMKNLGRPLPARATTPAAQVVCNAFVDQYYHILHQSPELVYRFYQDSSMLSRPELNGVMTSVTTMQAIKEMILSLNYKNVKGRDNDCRCTRILQGWVDSSSNWIPDWDRQSEEEIYPIIFPCTTRSRYSDENETPEMNPTLVDGSSENVPTTPLTPDPSSENVPTTPLAPDPELEPSQATDRPVMDPGTPSEEVIDNGGEVCDPSDNEERSVVEEVEVEQPSVHSSQNEEQPVVEMTPLVQEDASKKSYASIGYYHVDMWLSKVAVCWLGCCK